jgi:ABC-type branched-subunit amino acid transport system ATPase component
MAELIATRGLTKRFGGLTAVNQVDFSVHAGDVAGVIGPNGSGKTTLFNLLSGFFPPTEGTISFEGQDVTHHPPYKRVGLGMSRTFQLVSVFPSLSVWENLVLSCLRFKDHSPLEPASSSVGPRIGRSSRTATRPSGRWASKRGRPSPKENTCKIPPPGKVPHQIGNGKWKTNPGF